MGVKLSVIIPVYNMEKYLHRCLDSVIAGNFDDMEILIIDDGSTDTSSAICNEYEKCDGRIKVFHKQNSGLSDARNMGISEAVGEYLLFVDSDDWINPELYSNVVQKSKYENRDIVVFGYDMIDEDGNSCNIDFLVQEIESPIEAIRLLLDGKIDNYACNKLYRKELFSEIQYPTGRLLEDIGTTYLLFDRARKISCINDVFYHYFQRKDSITHLHSKKAIIDDLFLRIERRDFLKKNYPQLNNIQDQGLIASSLSYCFHVPKNVDISLYSEAIEILNKSKFDVFSLDRKHKLMLFFFKYFRMIFELISWFTKFFEK